MELVSVLPPGRKGNDHIAVVLGCAEVGPGDRVTLFEMWNTTPLGHYKVSRVVERAVDDINHQDLIGFVYGDPGLFQSRLRTAVADNTQYITVSFVTLSTDWTSEEVVEELELEAERTEPVIKKRPKRPRRTDEEYDHYPFGRSAIWNGSHH